ncbi:hypothetical protein MMYC01_204097 [Madurella mycetomatis]|uniref:F-box domain-containing protein n=1 Tax=Madurella mycetomatis TaxID=100816 RepID=A0A175W453_9PEZI|nr:hypothetical protein MMYC01_204797 [Madurella mycetomatis]KXX81102.1 hypothetical protein MMYC01_204097 [Madurella mycetomatis]
MCSQDGPIPSVSVAAFSATPSPPNLSKAPSFSPSSPSPSPSPSPSQSPSSCRLTSLPFELLLGITSLLDYGSVLRLSVTCHSFKQRLDPAAICTVRSKIAFYQHAERHFAQHAAKLVCFRCFRFLDPSQFSDLQRRGRRGKFSSHPDERAKRFCWDCGVHRGLYTHGGRVRKGGLRYEICPCCGEATVVSRACRLVVTEPVVGGDDGEAAAVILRDCSRRDDMLPRRASALEKLPTEVLERVMRVLGYHDLRALKRVSRYLRRVVDPVKHSGDVYGAWEFMMERLKKGAGEWYRGYSPRACFGCFRLRSKEQISWQQYDTTWPSMLRETWRRRCWECLRRFYHPVLADVEARERFNRQGICSRCRCLRYVDEDCAGCVARADVIAGWDKVKREKLANRGTYDLWDGAEKLVDWFDEPVVSSGGEPLPVQDDDVWDQGIGLWLDSVGLGNGDSSPSEESASSSDPASTDGDSTGAGNSTAGASQSSWQQLLGDLTIDDILGIPETMDNGENSSGVPLWHESMRETTVLSL